jgi:hypothetical protein
MYTETWPYGFVVAYFLRKGPTVVETKDSTESCGSKRYVFSMMMMMMMTTTGKKINRNN